MEKLRKRIAATPTSPGVYRWLNAKGEVLYIGKAKNLRSRLRSYLKGAAEEGLALNRRGASGSGGAWKEALLKAITDFDCTVTGNELEALILETNLIKEAKPKYNVLMKDDKRYVYLRVTVSDPYPHLSIVRQPAADGAEYFGPFLSLKDLEYSLDMLNEVCHFRACPRSLEELNARAGGREPRSLRLCLEGQIGECNGLCRGALSREEYRERVDSVMRFFRGDKVEILREARRRMEVAAMERRFEEAARFRDIVCALEEVSKEQIVEEPSQERVDAVGIASAVGKALAVVLSVRRGKVGSILSVPLLGAASSSASLLEQFLPQYYGECLDLPDAILVSEDLPEHTLLEQWFRDVRGKSVSIRTPERGRKSKLLALAKLNAKERMEQELTKWEVEERNTQDALTNLRDLLHLPTLPARIEGYDISHLTGTETVGSMAVFMHGKRAPDLYRSFTIQTFREGEIDDYKALREVLRRRFRHLTEDIQAEEKRFRKVGLSFSWGRGKEKMLVARRGKEQVGSVSLRKEGSFLLFIPPSIPSPLRDFLVRKFLRSLKKGKVYALVEPGGMEEYVAWGFRSIFQPPKKLVGKFPGACVMVYDTIRNRPDPSLSRTPSLILLDGGKGQLSIGEEVLRELGLGIPLIALAKGEEELFVPLQTQSLPLPKNSPALLLLMWLRDEAHRFANEHRQKRITRKLFTPSSL